MAKVVLFLASLALLAKLMSPVFAIPAAYHGQFNYQQLNQNFLNGHSSFNNGKSKNNLLLIAMTKYIFKPNFNFLF